MIFVTGGRSQGKRNYVTGTLGIPDAQIRDAAEEFPAENPAEKFPAEQIPAEEPPKGLTAERLPVDEMAACGIASDTCCILNYQALIRHLMEAGIDPEVYTARLLDAWAVPETDVQGKAPETDAQEMAGGTAPQTNARADMPEGRSTPGAAADRVIVMDEVGSGIVPMEKADRLWREACGRCGCMIAARADRVIRLVCGIPTIIKG